MNLRILLMHGFSKIWKLVIKKKSSKNLSFWLEASNQKDLETELNEIPSETSFKERLYLYWLAREITMSGKILEIGPFLGGTTRALAKGLNENIFLKEKKIITIDKFENYLSRKKLIEKLDLDSKIEINEKADFYELFKVFLKDKPYGILVSPIKAEIPNHPGVPFPKIDLNSKNSYSIMLVDGCKSWYSIKSIFLEIIDKLEISSYVIFQDYGRFTCFWVPLFCEKLKDYFHFHGSIDSTRVYRIKEKLSCIKLKEIFPDEASKLETLEVNSIFSKLIDLEAKHTKKTTLKIQYCAYLAYTNKKTEAKEILIKLLANKKNSKREKKMIKNALISPTYKPNGEKIFLDN